MFIHASSITSVHLGRCRLPWKVKRVHFVLQPSFKYIAVTAVARISLCFPLGAYIFIESSEPQRHRHLALLMGPRLCGRMCLQFFYNMNGSRMGTLNVYKREGMRSDDLLWTMSGNQGTDWHEALVEIGGACYQVLSITCNLVMV